MKITVCKTFTFAAAHFLPYHEGLCKNPHGHNYRLEIEVSGPIKKASAADKSPPPDTGMVIDFEELKQIVNDAVIRLSDHKNLNEIYMNPTAEIMVMYIFDGLQCQFSENWAELTLRRVHLWETDTSWAQASEG